MFGCCAAADGMDFDVNADGWNPHPDEAAELTDEEVAAIRALNEKHGATAWNGTGPATSHVVELKGKDFEELPEEVMHLPNLKVLRLDRCKKLKSLPKELAVLKHLNVLTLNHCSALLDLPDLKTLRNLDTVFTAGASDEAKQWKDSFVVKHTSD